MIFTLLRNIYSFLFIGGGKKSHFCRTKLMSKNIRSQHCNGGRRKHASHHYFKELRVVVALNITYTHLYFSCSQVRLLLGELGFFVSAYACATAKKIIIYSPGLKQTITFPALRICHSSTFQSKQYAGCLSQEPSLMA